MKYLLPLLFILAACSSAPEKKKTVEPETITNESFKKERPLSNRQVNDFYTATIKSMNPALQDETIDRYSKAEVSTINTETDPLLKISVLCINKSFKEAFELASKQFDRYQKVAAYWNQVANCHLNAGDDRKALLFYNKALEIKKDYVPALNNIGVMYSRQGQDQKALVAFERASEKGRFSKTPRYNLSKLYLTYGLAEKALPVFESLLNETPQDIDLLNAVATSYFLMGNYGKAFDAYQKIPQNLWSQAEIGLNLALTLKSVGKNEDAGKVFDMVDRPAQDDLKRYYKIVQDQLGDKR